MPGTTKTGQSDNADSLSRLVGNTPMAALRYRYREGDVQEILVKCEQYNLTNSIKDRVVLYALQKARQDRRLKNGDLIIDACRGHSGISLAAIGRAFGHRVKVVMPDTTALEIRTAVRSYGAELQLVAVAEEGFEACIKTAEAMRFHDGVFTPRQTAPPCDIEAHDRTTGREIGHYLLLERITPDAFVAGVGTGSTLMGVGKYLAAMYPDVAIRPVWAIEGGNHRINGFSNVSKTFPGMGKWIEIHDGDAILMAQKIAATVKLPVGFSSGANFLGAIKAQQELGGGSTVITIFPDGSRHYPSLSHPEEIKAGYLSPEVEIVGYKVLNKV